MKKLTKFTFLAVTVVLLAVMTIFASSALNVETATGLKTTKTSSTVTISWNKAKNATGYRVFEKVSGKWKTLKNTTATSYKATNLKAGTKHTYAVRAYGKENGKTVWAESFKTITTGTRPSQVKTLKATQTEDTVNLSWSKSTGATGYRIFKYNPSSKGWEIALRATSKTSATIKSLSSGKKYIFAVKPYFNTGSEIVWASNYTQLLTCTKPAAPSKVTAKATTSTVTLSWSKVSGATGYRIYRYNSSKKIWTALKTTTSRTYKATNLKPSTRYIFAVKPYIKLNDTTVWGSFKSVSVKTASVPTAADKKELEEVLAYLTYMAKDGYGSGNSSDEHMVAFAFITNPLFGIYEYYDEYYGWNSNYDTHAPCPESNTGSGWGWLPGDPLKRFDYTYAYAYYPADKVDWILYNVFGFKDMRNLNEKYQYYYNGYYYLSSGDGGDITYDARIDSLTPTSDGKYTVNYKISYANQNNFNTAYTAVVEFKKVGGKTCWSINSFKKK